MGMIYCAECKQPRSNNAFMCPHCGLAIPQREKPRQRDKVQSGQWVAGYLTLVLGIFVMIWAAFEVIESRKQEHIVTVIIGSTLMIVGTIFSKRN